MFALVRKIILLLLIAGPLYGLMQVDLKKPQKTTKSAHLAPNPYNCKEAIVHVYQAKEPRWLGALSVHTWIATKQKHSRRYVVYEVDGDRRFDRQPVLKIDFGTPDKLWYGQKPTIVHEIRGKKAERLIQKIQVVADNYPLKDDYDPWFGPNANTFVAHVIRNIEDFECEMPSNAVGKDFLIGQYFTNAPSSTGIQLSYKGVLGVMLAAKEGFELNIGGLVVGFSPKARSIKLPGVGEVRLGNITNTNE